MRGFQSGAQIETGRLVLRMPRPDDACRIADLINDDEIARMMAPVPHPYGLSDAHAFIEAALSADPARDRPLVIEHPSFGVIGGGGFHTEDGAILAETGYWLGRTFLGRGFATEALQAALAWARDGWGRRAILSGHFVDNPASGRVLEKAGFLYTGELRSRHSLGRGAAAATRMMVWLA